MGWAVVRAYLSALDGEDLRGIVAILAGSPPGSFGAALVHAIETERLLRQAATLDAFREAVRELPQPGKRP